MFISFFAFHFSAEAETEKLKAMQESLALHAGTAPSEGGGLKLDII